MAAALRRGVWSAALKAAAAPGCGAAFAARAQRRCAGGGAKKRVPTYKREAPAEKLTWKEMLAEYGFIGAVIVQTEYVLVGIVLYYLISFFALGATVVGWVGAETVDAWRAWMQDLPYLGPWVASVHPDTLTNAILALIVDEITWFGRAPFVVAAVPSIAKRLRGHRL
eukprot:TRINITY_DN1824_c0_g1_i1.p2 TRINITY_DN1824_c0_g1~~TRINITY_DN1824_c0_g1_i1.p2  ORF type:complete len:185 (+),score=62.09 TRINITY_DN1824_c0_g1_i1:54-557(+)